MENKIRWEISSFDGLDISTLYEILHLRAEVFVVEQNSPYQDVDNKDQLAIHVMGYIDDKLIAYSRLFRPDDYFDTASIGRVVVPEQYRQYGYGRLLMGKSIELVEKLFGEQIIIISAQLRLKSFYESFGFVPVSDVYQEDGIPHIRMKKGEFQITTQT